MTKRDLEKKESLEQLQGIIKPGDTIYTVLRHVSRSGMSRNLDCYIMEDKQPLRISYLVAKALGYPTNDSEIKVFGCGMDMGFSIVYGLGAAMFPGGFSCIGENGTPRCQSNDHHNYEDRKNTFHKDGGYALRHVWM